MSKSAGNDAQRPRPPARRRSRSLGGRLLFLAIPVLFLAIAVLVPHPRSDVSLLPPRGTALFLTAHPDDEVMFFAPSILALRREGWGVRGLCLSTGNADGLGEQRRYELTRSYASLGVIAKDVMVVDHPLLQDDLRAPWPAAVVQSVVSSYLSANPVALVITFDADGVSGHPNHISLSHFRSNSSRILHLRSPPLATKYLGPVPAILLNTKQVFRSTAFRPFFDVLPPFVGRRLKDTPRTDSTIVASSLGQWWISVRAMREHRTQMVWFRWLYLGFSQLMWRNEMELVV